MKLEEFIMEGAGRQGFSLAGITTAEPVDGLAHLEECVAHGRNASMGFLARDPKARCEPRSLLPTARSIICCAVAYDEEGFPLQDGEIRPTDTQKRARYARGGNYHKAIMGSLELLWKQIREFAGTGQAKLCVDTSPILEKALARRAGLGWLGKHTILVNEKFGSWFMLGEIITDLELAPAVPAKDICGDCAACINACPTGALIAPRTLDARKCISYWTTMQKGEVPSDIRRHIPNGAFGCDVCQKVCPYNWRGEK